MQIVSNGDNLHEMSKLVFLGKWEEYFNMSSVEIFTQNAKRQYMQQLIGSENISRHCADGI